MTSAALLTLAQRAVAGGAGEAAVRALPASVEWATAAADDLLLGGRLPAPNLVV